MESLSTMYSKIANSIQLQTVTVLGDVTHW